MKYDAESLRAFFNNYGQREWDRLEAALPGRVKAAIHAHILQKHLAEGMEVLDVGCGPGRFAVQMARAGAFVTLVDISDTQLHLAETRLAAAGLLGQVRGFHRLDATALTPLAAGAYDLTLCYGSVLSYLRQSYPEGLAELARVTRRGGKVVLSVTSLYGPMRMVGTLDAGDFVATIDRHLDWPGLAGGADVVQTTTGSPEFHQPMALFTTAGLKRALEDQGFLLLEQATSNPTLAVGSTTPKIDANPQAEARLIEVEVALCQRPGLLDAGEHLIAVGSRP